MRLRDLGTPRLTWRDLLVILKQAPITSAYQREAIGPDHLWDLSAQLQALAVDALHTLIWQQTKDGSKGKDPPKPIPRPGVSEPVSKAQAIPIDEMADWLGWEREINQN